MKFLILTALLSFLTLNSAAQKAPDKLEELQGMTRVYISTNNRERQQIIEAIDGKHGLTVVDRIESAQFYIGYEQSVEIIGRSDGTRVLSGQMDVYLRDGEKLRAVWIKAEKHDRYKDPLPIRLAKAFLKEYAKLVKLAS